VTFWRGTAQESQASRVHGMGKIRQPETITLRATNGAATAAPSPARADARRGAVRRLRAISQAGARTSTAAEGLVTAANEVRAVITNAVSSSVSPVLRSIFSANSSSTIQVIRATATSGLADESQRRMSQNAAGTQDRRRRLLKPPGLRRPPRKKATATTNTRPLSANTGRPPKSTGSKRACASNHGGLNTSRS